MIYDKRIDGLRAIAVLTVIIYHLNFFYNGFKIFPGGFFGVDIFFVISGYLITGILLDKKITLKEFYIKRARRILPMLLIVVSLTSIAGYFILLPAQLIELSETSLSNLLFSSNIYFWLEGQKYADETSLIKPLLHTWTLSVEEQFYFFYPLILLFFKRNNRYISIVLLISFTSLFFSKLIEYYAPNFNFYLIFSRAWEIGFGCSIYFLKKHLKFKPSFLISEILGFFGLFLIFFSICFFNDKNNYPNFSTLLPVIGTFIILVNNNHKSLVNKFLQIKPLTIIGLISYSMYLWHYPIISYAKLTIFNESVQIKILHFLIIFVLSLLSYNFIERVFRDSNIINLRKFCTFLFLIISFIIFLNFLFIIKDGFSSRYAHLKTTFINYEPNNSFLTQESWKYLSDSNGKKKVFFDSKNDEKIYSPAFNSSDKYKVLIIGDSHSKDLFNVFYSNKSEYSKYEFARYGFNLEWFSNNDNKIKIFKNSNLYKNSDIIIISTRWNLEKIKNIENFININENKKIIIASSSPEFKLIRQVPLFDYLIKNNTNIKKSENLEEAIKKVNQFFFKNKHSGYQLINNKLLQKAAKLKIKILNKDDLICNYKLKECFGVDNMGNKIFYDYGHYTIDGAYFL